MTRLFTWLLLFAAGICCSFSLETSDTSPTVADLGKKLFFDKILSSDYSISCESCHREAFAFSDTLALSKGVGGKLGTRNAPSVMNMSARPYFFYDGRALTLEEQVFHPVRNPVEMNLPVAEAVNRVRSDKDYVKLFKQVFRKQPDSILIGKALSAYVRTLESPGNARADIWLNTPGSDALNPSEIRGRFIFMNKGKCFDCHFSPDFTGDEFRNIGTYNGKNFNDAGRYDVTKNPIDLGKFKVPGLRNVQVTGPYMHNGMFKTLREVVDFYDNPDLFVPDAVNKDSLLMKPLNLSETEKEDLVHFLESLTDREYVR